MDNQDSQLTPSQPPEVPSAPQTSRKWIVIAGIALVVIVGIVIAIMMSGDKKESSGSDDTSDAVTEKYQAASLETHAEAAVRTTIISRLMTDLESNVRTIGSAVAVSPKSAEVYGSAVTEANDKLTQVKTLLKDLESMKGSLKDDEKGYQETGTFIAEVKKQLARIEPLVKDATDGKDWLYKPITYETCNSHPVCSKVAANNPQSPMPAAEVKALAGGGLTELDDLVKKLTAFKPTSDFMKFMKAQYVDLLKTQESSLDTLTKSAGDFAATYAFSSAVLDSSTDSEAVQKQVDKNFAASVMQDLQEQSAKTPTALGEYATEKFKIDDFAFIRAQIAELEPLRDDLDPAFYEEFKISYEAVSDPEKLEEAKRRLREQFPGLPQ